MGQAINILVALLIYGATILVLIATVAAAIAAGRSFWVSRRILYYQLLSRYSSPEMGKALDIMWELSRVRDEDTKKTEFFKILRQYRDFREGQNPTHTRIEGHIHKENGQHISFCFECQEINQARRQVSHFFTTTFEMFSETKALDKACFKKICELNCFKLLYDVIEWFELAQATSWKFDPEDVFTKLLEQSGRKDIENLKKRVQNIEDLTEKSRPPETWDEIEQMMQPKQPPSEQK